MIDSAPFLCLLRIKIWLSTLSHIPLSSPLSSARAFPHILRCCRRRCFGWCVCRSRLESIDLPTCSCWPDRSSLFPAVGICLYKAQISFLAWVLILSSVHLRSFLLFYLTISYRCVIILLSNSKVLNVFGALRRWCSWRPFLRLLWYLARRTSRMNKFGSRMAPRVTSFS